MTLPHAPDLEHSRGSATTPSGVDRVSPLDLQHLFEEATRTIGQERPPRTRSRRRGWLLRRALAAADLGGLALAFVTAQLVVPAQPLAPNQVHVLSETLVFLATLPAWVLLARAYGLYDRDEERADHSSVDDVWSVVNMVTLGTWILYAGTLLTSTGSPSPAKLMTFWASGIVFVTGGRVVARAAARHTAAYVQNTLILGAGAVGQLIAKKFHQHPEYGINVVGFVDSNPIDLRPEIGGVGVVGRPEHIAWIVEVLGVERVIVAFSQDSHETTLDALRELEALDVRVDVVPRLFEGVPPESYFHAVEGLTLIGLPRARLSRTSLLLKRCFDVSAALAGLVLLSPLLLVIALAIAVDTGRPILFRQTRMGRKGNRFRIVKFRTMRIDAESRKHEVAHLNKHLEANGDPRMFKVPDDPRITRVGRFLRRTSLDELPQLWNVLRGDMSLVGPRPLILDEHQHVGGWGLTRLELKPGITGLWQVLGRDDIPFHEMVELDYRYVTSWSLWSDLKLIARTLPALLRRRTVQ